MLTSVWANIPTWRVSSPCMYYMIVCTWLGSFPCGEMLSTHSALPVQTRKGFVTGSIPHRHLGRTRISWGASCLRTAVTDLGKVPSRCHRMLASQITIVLPKLHFQGPESWQLLSLSLPENGFCVVPAARFFFYGHVVSYLTAYVSVYSSKTGWRGDFCCWLGSWRGGIHHVGSCPWWKSSQRLEMCPAFLSLYLVLEYSRGC